MVNQESYWPNDVQQMLLQAVLMPDDRSFEGWKDWNSAIDLTDIDYDSCCLIPCLYERLKTQDISTYLLGTMKGIYRKVWYKNQILFNHLEYIATKVENLIVFKGAALVLGYYQDYGKRPVEELEILVMEPQKEELFLLLQQLGWQKERKSQYIWRFIQPKDRCKIDIHCSSLQKPIEGLDEHFWQGCQSLEFKNIACKVLSAQDQLLHVLIDGVHSERVSPLRWVLDASTIIQQTPEFNWLGFIDTMNHFNLNYPTENMLNYLKDVFDLSIPEKL